MLVGGDFSCVNCIREWRVGEFKPKGGRRGRIVEGAVRAARSDRSFRPSQRLLFLLRSFLSCVRVSSKSEGLRRVDWPNRRLSRSADRNSLQYLQAEPGYP